MKSLNIRSLSRAQRIQLQNSESFGDLAETIVSEVYELNPFIDASWYDATDESTGVRYEVKSTATEVGDKYPGDGRFRLWKGQHTSLTRSQGAFYAFVLLDEQTGKLRVERMRPTKVTGIIQSRGGWNTANHGSRSDKQHKLPHGEVF